MLLKNEKVHSVLIRANMVILLSFMRKSSSKCILGVNHGVLIMLNVVSLVSCQREREVKIFE